MRIVLTNDDGILAPGLLALKTALAPLGEVVPLAPDRPRSACGHAVTLHKPLRVTPVVLPDGSEGLSCNGTPSDCVGLAVSGHIGPRPDLIVSGINLGPNVGWDLTYSGTVAAAMEAAINGLPSFAVSVDTFEPTDYTPAAAFAAHLAGLVLREGLPRDTFLNVNVPVQEIRGVSVTTQGRTVYEGVLERRLDPRGRAYFWWTGDRSRQPSEPDTDVTALRAQRISVTPVKLDLTEHAFLPELRHWEMSWPRED